MKRGIMLILFLFIFMFSIIAVSAAYIPSVSSYYNQQKSVTSYSYKVPRFQTYVPPSSDRFYRSLMRCSEYYFDDAPFFCAPNSDPMIVLCTHGQRVVRSYTGCITSS